MKKKHLFPALAAFAVLALAIGAGSALADDSFERGENRLRLHANTELSAEQKNDLEEKFSAVNKALEAGDYNAWRSAHQAINANCPLFSKINADNFDRYAEAYKLRKQASEIMTELGLEPAGRGHGFMSGRGQGQGRMMGQSFGANLK